MFPQKNLVREGLRITWVYKLLLLLPLPRRWYHCLFSGLLNLVIILCTIFKQMRCDILRDIWTWPRPTNDMSIEFEIRRKFEML